MISTNRGSLQDNLFYYPENKFMARVAQMNSKGNMLRKTTSVGSSKSPMRKVRILNESIPVSPFISKSRIKFGQVILDGKMDETERYQMIMNHIDRCQA